MRLLPLLLLCLVGLVGVTAQTQPRTGLCVSSSSNTSICDVAVNGVATSAWQLPTIQYLNSAQPQLFVTINSQTLPPTQSIDVVYDYEFATTAPAVWSLNNETILATEPSTTGGTLPATTTSFLVCNTNGWSNYTISLIMLPYDPIILFFQKQCSKPVMEVGTYIEDSNVIHKSKPVSAFAPYIYTAAQTNLTFEVFLNPQQDDPNLVQQPFTLTLTSSVPDELMIQANGIQGWSGFALQGFESEINVGFVCTGNTKGTNDIIVTGVLDFQWSPAVVFTFHYRCTIGTSVPGLNVGSTSGAADMASNGVTVGSWATTYVYAPDATYDFNLYIDSTTLPSIDYNATVVAEDTGVFTMRPTTPTWGTLVQIAGKPNEILFHSKIVCQSEGVARGLVQFEFGTLYMPIQFQFRYECVFPLFDIGDGPLGTNIISQGVDQGWVGVATATMDVAKIFLMLDSTSTIPSNYYQLSVTSYDATTMAPTIVDEGHGNATLVPSTAIISFNCLPCQAIENAPITIAVYWGWSGVAEISMLKTCTISDADQCDTGSGGSWSPVGIAAFVIFLLITSFCISGCFYNRFSQHKSGWSIVPLADTTATCIDRCRTGGRHAGWSPQEDGGSYQSSFAAAGHANYSTNL